MYQKGNHGYQNIPRKERQSFLLIDGQPTTEVDFTTLHPCIFLNREGRECPKDMYSEVLKQLGIRKSKKRRAAIKNVILSALNMNTVHGIYTFTGQQESYQGNLKDHCKPIDIYNAIITLYPELKQYLGDGDNSDRLQAADSIIMIDILERLAKMGIVGLPLHDSVICKVPHKAIVEREMKAVYEAYMGFDIHVK
ncbi:MAG: hypothetical protein HQ553_09590 [Chloroflexi bacterium]|nr:hypothetical protein [Chloroflexota bacterium]